MLRKLFGLEEKQKPYQGFIDTITKLSEDNINYTICRYALSEACAEVYKYTGNAEMLNPDYFINEVKKKYYFV